MAWEAVYKYYYWARMNVRLFRLRYRSPELYLWHGQQMQVRCHILAKSINFTYDTLWWFAMRYRYHEVESLRPQLPVSPLPARSSSQALVSLFPSAFPQHPYRSLQKPPYEPYHLFIASKHCTGTRVLVGKRVGHQHKTSLAPVWLSSFPLSMDTAIRASALAIIPFAI